MTSNLEALGARDALRELADHYETIASLDLTPESGGARSVAGPRLPPGVQELLNVDEVQRALTDVDDWAEFCSHVLVDELAAFVAPNSTAARLRAIGDHGAHFLDHPDEALAITWASDLGERVRALRRLARRGERTIHTGRECQDPACAGHYTAPLSGEDGPLICSRCRDRVPYSVWSSWPRARVEWITVEHAARMVGTTVIGVRIRASRGNWRRVQLGREARYHVDDVTGVA